MNPLGSVAVYLHQRACYAQLRFLYSRERIQRFLNLHQGRAIFCIGAGPSLRSEDLALLDGQILIFVNRSFELLAGLRPQAAYWIVQDFKNLVRYRDIDRTLFSASFRSVHQWSHSCLRSPFRKQDIILMPRITTAGRGWPVIEAPGNNFSSDVSETIGMTPTVIFTAIQVAAYMGAGRIGLLGVDLDYSSGPAHFYDDQVVEIAKARRFEAAVRPVLGYYHTLFNSERPRLYNCTCQTRDDILPRVRLRDFIGLEQGHCGSDTGAGSHLGDPVSGASIPGASVPTNPRPPAD